MYRKIKYLYKALLIVGFISNPLFSQNTSSNTLQSDTNEIIINNIPLSYKISLLSSNSRFIYDLLDARVKIKNNDTIEHNLEYKFVWYDIGGFEMAKHLSKWRHVKIDAKDTIILKDLAISPKIDSFKFYIRGLKD
jgi:uncharacterized protein YcfL